MVKINKICYCPAINGTLKNLEDIFEYLGMFNDMLKGSSNTDEFLSKAKNICKDGRCYNSENFFFGEMADCRLYIFAIPHNGLEKEVEELVQEGVPANFKDLKNNKKYTAYFKVNEKEVYFKFDGKIGMIIHPKNEYF